MKVKKCSNTCRKKKIYTFYKVVIISILWIDLNSPSDVVPWIIHFEAGDKLSVFLGQDVRVLLEVLGLGIFEKGEAGSSLL